MPMPSVLPTMTARPKPRPSTRRRPLGCVELRLELDSDDVDRFADVARRMTRAARFEFDVAGLPAIHHRLAIRRVLDLAARQMDDDDVGAVRVNALARVDVHVRAKNRRARVIE